MPVYIVNQPAGKTAIGYWPREAAERLGISVRRTRRWIATGYLHAIDLRPDRPHAPRYVVPFADVEALIAMRKGVAR